VGATASVTGVPGGARAWRYAVSEPGTSDASSVARATAHGTDARSPLSAPYSHSDARLGMSGCLGAVPPSVGDRIAHSSSR